MSARMIRKFAVWIRLSGSTWEDISCDVSEAGEKLGGRAINRQSMACGTDAIDVSPAEDTVTLRIARTYDADSLYRALRNREGEQIDVKIWPDPTGAPTYCESFVCKIVPASGNLKIGEWDLVEFTLPVISSGALDQAQPATLAGP